jgi:tetraacyldisaccharide 4'-kinase
MREPSAWWNEPSLAARLLAPLATLHGAIAAYRMTRAGRAAAVPVICVGNLTVGGAGKTPTAIAIARLLQAAGHRPFFLSRGYGGRNAGLVTVDAAHDARDVGDEPLLLARVAPTVVARDRVAGAAAAVAAGAGIIVMDDGFQNASLRKDIAVVVVDGQRGVGNGMVIPAGPLRAPLAVQMRQAHVVLLIGDASPRALRAIAVAKDRHLPILHGRIEPDPSVVSALQGERILAFAGIADPDKFFVMLAAVGIPAFATVRFSDHHRYRSAEAAELICRAERDKLTLVTTEKDYARLCDDPALAELRARAKTLPVKLVFSEEDAIGALLAKVGG